LTICPAPQEKEKRRTSTIKLSKQKLSKINSTIKLSQKEKPMENQPN
jgi:hypothetical protein